MKQIIRLTESQLKDMVREAVKRSINEMKYMGSKRRIADDILDVIYKHSKPTNMFVDLFCGSCSIIERVPDTYKRYANDYNPFLIEMFKALQDGVEFPTNIPKEEYARIRDKYNKAKGDISVLTKEEIAEIGWYGWMASYNGRFFDGGYSGHDVNGRDYIGEQIRNIMVQIKNLKDINFLTGSYDVALDDINDIEDGAIVYCDPPYKNTKGYSNSSGFDYDKFYDWCRMNKDRYQIFISEYWMPDDFEVIWQKELTNSMHQKNTKKPIEKLFKA